MSRQINLKASTPHFGCGSVTTALMRESRGLPYVRVVPSVEGASVSVHGVMADHTATDPFAPRTAGWQKEEGLVT